jgi:hypothetical protein
MLMGEDGTSVGVAIVMTLGVKRFIEHIWVKSDAKKVLTTKTY